MTKPMYILSDGIIMRKQNTIYFVNKENKRQIPIENLSDIYCYGRVTIKSGAASLIMKSGIPVHFFNRYGYYEGSLYPKAHLNSGTIIVKQAEYYLDSDKRIEIATEMIRGIKHNILQTLKYYKKHDKNVDCFIESIEKETPHGSIETLRSIEGNLWKHYYQSFNYILQNFEMTSREYRPPSDEINALISFGNSLLYATTLSEIYNTYLHPSISFIHEPSERRFSLALDIADIFKPILVERTIFNLVNKKKILAEDFEKNVGTYLNNSGKEKFISTFLEKINSTIQHPNLNRKVSYRYLIRLECYKLIKHLLGDKKYVSFKMWW